MSKYYYTIGQVAEMLGESVSLVRYWSSFFSEHIHPARNAKGNRLFYPSDVEVLKKIHFLVKTQGLSLALTAKQLSNDSGDLERRLKVMDSLKEIRAQLVEIKKNNF